MLLFFVLLTLGVLAKSVQALLFVPGLGLYLRFQKRFAALFKVRSTNIGLGLFILVAGGFYLLRGSSNPGYLQAVWENELGGRCGASLEKHEAGWNFYILMLIDHHFTSWWSLVPVGIAMGLAHRDEALRKWTLLLVCLGATYLYVISTAGTELEWYEAPLFPILGGLAAVPLYVVLQ